MINEFKIAVVGASGAVGEVMLSILAERGIDANRVTALASERSAGDDVEYGSRRLIAAGNQRLGIDLVELLLVEQGDGGHRNRDQRQRQRARLVPRGRRGSPPRRSPSSARPARRRAGN